MAKRRRSFEGGDSWFRKGFFFTYSNLEFVQTHLDADQKNIRSAPDRSWPAPLLSETIVWQEFSLVSLYTFRIWEWKTRVHITRIQSITKPNHIDLVNIQKNRKKRIESSTHLMPPTLRMMRFSPSISLALMCATQNSRYTWRSW